MRENYYDVEPDKYLRPLNWDNDIYWETGDYPDQAYSEVMDLCTYHQIYGTMVK